ncbi:unnamed protein product [Prunus brigantina]
MSSPKTRAQGSSSSVPPDYITGAGVDNHAIENVLHLFENTLVLGPHWFGPVPPEMAELMRKDAEAPLCFENTSALASHTWVSKNLSRSFPSSEVRNSPVKWVDWIDRLLPRYGPHWKRAVIYDAILLSKQSINMDENLLAAALCFWNSASNTFDFRMGPMAPTLLDMAQIFGFRPHGRPVDAVGDYHRRKNQEKLSKPFTISPASINQNCSFSNYLKKFSAEKDKDQQHMLFLLYWLNRFIFPNRSSAVLLEYRHLAEALHNHTNVGLGPTVLAHLFKNLYSATLENPLNLTHCTKRSVAQWQVVIRRTYPWFQLGYRLFEKEPKEEAARTDFKKKFLSVTLPRDLPYGGGKPPNYHLGVEVYHPNFCARQLGCPQLIPLKSYRSCNRGSSWRNLDDLEVQKDARCALLHFCSVLLCSGLCFNGPFLSIAAGSSSHPSAKSKRLRKRKVVEYVASEDNSAVPTATSGTDDELREAFEEVEKEKVLEELERSTAVPVTEEQAEQSASGPVEQAELLVLVPETVVSMATAAPEVVEVPKSANVLAVVTNPLEPPIVAMPIHSLAGSSATASFANPELAEFEAMVINAQLDKLEKLSSPPGKAKSKAVEEAMERLKIWQSSELELDEDREAFDQLMRDLDLLHRQNMAPRPILEMSLGLARDVLNLHDRYEDLKPTFKTSEFCKATHEANLADFAKQKAELDQMVAGYKEAMAMINA